MKKNLLCFSVLFLFAVSGFSDVKNFRFQQVEISYYPGDNYLQVCEYNILHQKGSGDIENDFREFCELAEKAQAAGKRFGLKDFNSAEEKVMNMGQYVNARYDLISVKNSSLKQIEDIFSKILERNVNVEFKDNHIVIIFEGQGVEILDSNAEHVFQKGNICSLEWSNRIRVMEVTIEKDTVNTEQVCDFFPLEISSPEKTAEEIDFMRYGLPELTGVERELQDNCDIIRLKHLEYYGKLIEEYKEKTGHYPFQNNVGGQTYAFIYNNKQKKYARDTNPEIHTQLPPKTFINELEKGLGRKIDQMYDPQYAPTSRPVFYIYMIQGDTFYFAVHLSKYYSFSKRVDDHYYKVEISNVSEPSYKIWSLNDLLANPKFIEGKNMEIMKGKEGYFQEREDKHRHEY